MFNLFKRVLTIPSARFLLVVGALSVFPDDGDCGRGATRGW